MQINDKLMKNYLKKSDGIEKPITLYEGTTAGNITLNDDVSNYKYIEIYYHDNDAVFNSVKVEDANNKLVQFYGGYFAAPEFYQKNGRAKINGNTISFESSITIELTYNKYPQITEGSNIFAIVKVLGYKEE